MGIKYLNKFLRNECQNSIKITSIADLSGKKIAVDISIYLYKFASDDSLIENMYLMLSVFRHYNVIPIFIFDGKPPPEKKELLIKRREDKKEAEQEFKKLQQKLVNNEDMDYEEKQEISTNMDLLKKKFITITKEQIDSVKELIRAYGATYYDALGEADELCAQLVIKNKVYACLSEDMDMFVYGCSKVLRYLSLLKHTFVVYDTKNILQMLGMTQNEFRTICVISGTHYNIHTHDQNDKNAPTLDKTIKLFKKYKSLKKDISFDEWLHQDTDYIQDYSLYLKVSKMFDLNFGHTDMEIFDTIRITNGPIMKDDMKKILEKDGFVFSKC
jgi:flap endonuclease-1